jgi:hypothetical protein
LHRKNPPPCNLIEAFQAWTKQEFRKAFSDGGAKLKYGKQPHYFSCGTYVENMFAHDLFNDLIATDCTHHLSWMEHFVCIMKAQCELVSCLK